MTAKINLKLIKFAQVNADRHNTTHDLLEQIAYENKIDIILGQEPNKKRTKKLFCDKREDCFISVNKGIKILKVYQGEGFVCLELETMNIYSCYFSPNRPLNEFENYLDNLQSHLRSNTGKKCIIGGDFNTKSMAWGSTITNERSQPLEDFIETHNLVVMNVGNTPTFQNANGSSIIDITLATTNICQNIKEWRVMEETENMSNHRTISFDVALEQTKKKQNNIPIGWKLSDDGIAKLKENCQNLETNEAEANIAAEQLVQSIKKKCDKTLTKKIHPKQHHFPAYWWTPDIAEKRKTCIRYRRILTRLNKANNRENEKENTKRDYKKAKQELKTVILKQKKKCWDELYADLDRDIWGKAYKIVTSKIKLKPCIAPKAEKIEEEIRKLFPIHPIAEWPDKQIRQQEITEFTPEEIAKVTKYLKMKKAPGPDGIPNEVVKAVSEVNSESIRQVMNKCLMQGTFPAKWKIATLVLIPKPGKGPQAETKYRPICLLDSIGKFLERLIKERLEEELEEKNIIADNQHGYRAKRSTITALKKVQEARELARKKEICCIMVTIDVANAFNSVPWKGIIAALRKAEVSEYLIRIIQSYLEDRYILREDGNQTRVTCGVPQGSVLGPLLWNVFYDQILRLNLGKAVELVAYADDLAIIVKAKTKEFLEECTQYAVEMVINKLEQMGLKVAAAKTESVALAGERKISEMKFIVGEEEVNIKNELKYMGIYIDKGVKMTTHVKKICEKTNKVLNDLTKITANVGGPRSSKRKVLMMAATSIILYGAPIWQSALKYKKYELMLERINRKMAIRITSAYRTVPTTAILVLAGNLPIKLSVEERVVIYERGKGYKIEARNEAIQKWQTMWDNYEGWTKIFIRNVKDWLQRKWGETNYYLTQALTGHGVFGTYLHRIGKAENDRCWYCEERDTAQHTIFECIKWVEERRVACERCGIGITRENIAELIMRSEESWNIITGMMESIMKNKNIEERNRLNR